MRSRSRHATWIVALALAGLALAVGLAFLASRLSAQHIGLAGESPSAGAALVTRTATEESSTTTTDRQRSHAKPRKPARTTPVAAPAPVTPTLTPTPTPAPVSPTPATRTGVAGDSSGTRDRDDVSPTGQRRHDTDD